MIIANGCSLAAGYVLYRLVALDFGDSRARRVSWLLAFFPTSLFLFAGYSEGLFLLCIVLCFYCLRREHWWQAGLYGALATATRPTGVIMLLPLLIAWYEAHADQLTWLRRRYALGLPMASWMRRNCWNLGAVAIAPLGLLSFMGYLWVRFGNPLIFSTSQRSWHRALAWPWQTLQAAITRPLAGAPQISTEQLHGCLDALWAVVFLGITICGARALPRVYAGFLWLFWALTLCTPELQDGFTDPLISLPRFLLTAFPLLIILSATRRRAWIAAGVALPLLILNTLVFVSGGWVA
jgi:hypothetical protein